MRKFFENKVIIITGASSGIGKALTIQLARYGAKLILASRNIEKLSELKDNISEINNSITVMGLDVTDNKAITLFISRCIERFGKIDIVISNSGQYIQKKFDESGISDFEASFKINFFPSYNLLKEVLSHFRKNEAGHFVSINSFDAKKGIIGDSPYVASKSALSGFCEVMRQELKHENVFITSVYPGRVDTPMIEHLVVPKISRKMSPEKVAIAIIKGITKRESEIIIPMSYRAVSILNQIAPNIVDYFYKILKLEGKIK